MARDIRINPEDIPNYIKDNLELNLKAMLSNFSNVIITNKFYTKNESKEGYDLEVLGYFEEKGKKYNFEVDIAFDID